MNLGYGKMKELLAVGMVFGCMAGAMAATIDNPNVVLIVCDDLNDYVSSIGGHPQAITPNMEKLAKSGVSFSQAYCNVPICGPSRSSFMSGIYPHTAKNPLPRNQITKLRC
jgi:choline-sulfatase